MPVEASITTDRTTFPRVSQYSDTSSILTQFLELVPAEEYPIDSILALPWFDPLDERIQRLMRRITGFDAVDYNGEPITTISAAVYGHTSLWWLILLYNGAFHQDELLRPSKLKIPRLAASIGTMMAIRRSNEGKVVTA